MKRRWLILAAIPVSLACLFLNEIECFVGRCVPSPSNSWFSGWLVLVMGIGVLSLLAWFVVLPASLLVRKRLPPLRSGLLVGATCAASFTIFLHFTQGPLTLINTIRYLFLPLMAGWVAFSWLISKQWPNLPLNTNAPPNGGAPVS